MTIMPSAFYILSALGGVVREHALDLQPSSRPLLQLLLSVGLACLQHDPAGARAGQPMAERSKLSRRADIFDAFLMVPRAVLAVAFCLLGLLDVGQQTLFGPAVLEAWQKAGAFDRFGFPILINNDDVAHAAPVYHLLRSGWLLPLQVVFLAGLIIYETVRCSCQSSCHCSKPTSSSFAGSSTSTSERRLPRTKRSPTKRRRRTPRRGSTMRLPKAQRDEKASSRLHDARVAPASSRASGRREPLSMCGHPLAVPCEDTMHPHEAAEAVGVRDSGSRRRWSANARRPCKEGFPDLPGVGRGVACAHVRCARDRPLARHAVERRARLADRPGL
jgi:hypothetical protein